MFPDFSSILSSSSQIVTVLTSSSVFSEQADQFSEPLRTLKRIAKASADPQVSRIELETFPAKIVRTVFVKHVLPSDAHSFSDVSTKT